MAPFNKAFPSKQFRSTNANDLPAKYRSLLKRRPFLLFGLPFITTMLAGSFFLTPATAIRYERNDRLVQRVGKEEELGLGKDRRKFDMKDEFYRLSMKDVDNWEQKRVERFKGEPDGVL